MARTSRKVKVEKKQAALYIIPITDRNHAYLCGLFVAKSSCRF
jgi:hypothetical protein